MKFARDVSSWTLYDSEWKLSTPVIMMNHAVTSEGRPVRKQVAQAASEMRMILRNNLFRLAVIFLCLKIAVVAQNAEPKLATLDLPTWDRITSKGGSLVPQLDLILLRYDTSFLDDTNFMKYFITLNNCGDRNVAKGLNNEFDYPSMVAFYKPRAQEIVKFVPNTFSINMGTSFYLGEYDMTRKAFPFVDGLRKRQVIAFNNVTPVNSPTGIPLCPGTNRSYRLTDTYSTKPAPFPEYMVTFNEIKFAEVAVDEATARSFAARFPGGLRPVSIILDIEVLPDPPKIVRKKMAGTVITLTYVTFAGVVKKVSVLTSLGQPLATINP